MYVDFKLANSKFPVQPMFGGADPTIGAWQVGKATERAELHRLIDDMWDAVEKKANEFQRSQSQAG